VTREDFRRELGNAMDSISGSPDPALPERVRAAMVHAPEQRGPVWIAAVAAAVIAVILVGVLLVVNPLNRGSQVPGGVIRPTPTCCPSYPTPAPTPSASPSATPSASPSATPLVCTSGSTTFTNQGTQPVELISAVRTGSHPGADRITIEFKAGLAGTTIQIVPQANSKFTGDASGATVVLAGKYGLLIKITGADNHTAFTGSYDIKSPSFAEIREARNVGDFEGVVHWGVGLASSACYQATFLSNPTRLVIDIRNS
jgi:hypothetical protein